MGRIVGSPGNIFGRRRTKITGIGRPARRDKTKDTITALQAISGGLKVFEQAANLGTLIGGGIDRAVRNKKRDAARKALEQDRVTQQGQVDAAVSEAGQALESIPRLQEPDTSPGGAVDAGTQQFLQSIGLSGPTLGQSLSGSLMPSRALVSEEDAAARLAGLRDRSGPGSVIADMGKMSPEEAYAASELNEAQLRAQADRLEEIKSRRSRELTIPEGQSPISQLGLTAQDMELGIALDERIRAGVASEQERQLFQGLSDDIYDAIGRDLKRAPGGQQQIDSALTSLARAQGPREGVADRAKALRASGLDLGAAVNIARGEALKRQLLERGVTKMSSADMRPTMSQDVAMTVSPELTRPIVTPPTTDLSQLEDVGITSQRAIDTYDPAQLIAASGFAENEQQLQSLLRAAEREATPTTFADLLSGKSVKALQGDIIKQFGKNRKKPLTEEQRLKNLKLRKEISDMSGIESRRASAEKSRAQAAKVRKQIEELDAKIKKDKEKASKDKDYLRIRRGLSKKQRAIEDQYSKYLDQYAKANSLKDPDAKKRRLDSLKSSVPLFVGDDGELVSPIISESQFSRLLESAGLDRKRINRLVKARGYDSSNKRLSMMEFPSAATKAVGERVGETADTEAAEKKEKKAVRLRKADALEKIRKSRLKTLGELQALKNPSPEQKAEIKYLRSSTDNLEERIKLLEAEGVESEIYEVPNPAGQ